VRLHGGRVEKIHTNAQSAAFEAERLAQLHSAGLAVPRLLKVSGNIIFMEYIDAKPLPDLIDEWERNPDIVSQEKAAKGLIDWLHAYYMAVGAGTSRGDINGRNFLFDGEKIWGVDFEEETHGTPMEDIGQLLAFILTYHPDHTSLKVSLSNIIARHAAEIFHLNPQEIQYHQNQAVELIRARRNKKI